MSVPKEYQDQAQAYVDTANAFIEEANGLAPLLGVAVAGAAAAFKVALGQISTGDPCVVLNGDKTQVDLSKTESQAMLLLIPDKVQVQLPPNDVIVFPRVDEATIRDDAWQMRRGGDDGLQAMRTDSGDTVFVLNGGKAQVVLYGRSEDSSSDSEGQAVSPVASWAEMASDGGSSSGAAVAVLPNGAFQVKGPMLGPFNAIMILPDGTFAASTRSAAQGGKEVAEGLAPGTTAAAPIATTGIPTVEAAERAQARFKGLRKRTQEQLGKAREATAIAELHIAKVKSLRVAAEGMSATALAKLAANVEKGGPEIGMVVLEDGSKVAIPEPGKVKAVVLSDSQGQIIFDAETRVIWMPAGGSDNDGGNGGGGGGAKVSESSSSMQCILDDTSATLIQMGDATKTATTVFQNGDKQVQTEAKETMSRRAFESTIKLGANQVSGMVQQPTIDDIFGNPIDNGAPAQVHLDDDGTVVEVRRDGAQGQLNSDERLLIRLPHRTSSESTSESALEGASEEGASEWSFAAGQVVAIQRQSAGPAAAPTTSPRKSVEEARARDAAINGP